MDGNRFDDISRSFAGRSTRRQALRRAGSGGVLAGLAAAVGIGRLPAAAQDDAAGRCTLQLSATVSVGPDKGDDFAGELEFALDQDGAIDDGVFRSDEGDEFDVVGQATGRAINLRIALADDRVLSLVGTAARDVARCRGDIDGTFGGPSQGSLGTWRATRGGTGIVPSGTSSSGAGGTESGGSSDTSGGSGDGGGQGPTPTPCPPKDCGPTFVLDPATCECGCPQPYVKCGDATCCFGGAVCNPDGSCQCPAGTEPCNEVCTPSCPADQHFDAACQCTAETSCGAGETLCNGQCVSIACNPNQLFDQASCTCVNRCSPGQDYCGGTCIDVVNDRTNCGFCGNVCPPNMPCIAGSCQCPATTSYVNGMCQ